MVKNYEQKDEMGKEGRLRSKIHKEADGLLPEESAKFKSYLVWILDTVNSSQPPPAYRQEERL